MSISKVNVQQINFVLLASSIYLIVSVFGFIGSNATSSSALQLNSYYNAIAAVAGFASFFILRGFNQDSKKFTFGLERFIPLLTLVEGLLIFSVSQNACASSTQLIFSGGSENPVNSTTLIYQSSLAYVTPVTCCISIMQIRLHLATFKSAAVKKSVYNCFSCSDNCIVYSLAYSTQYSSIYCNQTTNSYFRPVLIAKGSNVKSSGV